MRYTADAQLQIGDAVSELLYLYDDVSKIPFPELLKSKDPD